MSRYWDDELIHYASKYYDPVKAHEYYEQHKHLVGRHSTKGMTKEQKEAWKITKANIHAEKKGEKKATTDSQAKELQSMRDSCNKAKEEITAKIKAKVDEINGRMSKASEEIAKKQENLTKYSKNITRLVDLPKNASEAQIAAARQRIQRETQHVQKQKESLNKEASSVREKGKKEISDTSTSGQAEKAALGENLKSTIESVRATYKEKLKGIDDKYNQILDSEYAKIKSGK